MAQGFQIAPRIRGMVEILRPKDAQQPILPVEVRAAVRSWMTELFAEEELRAVEVKPRRTAMLSGPPKQPTAICGAVSNGPSRSISASNSFPVIGLRFRGPPFRSTASIVQRRRSCSSGRPYRFISQYTLGFRYPNGDCRSY